MAPLESWRGAGGAADGLRDLRGPPTGRPIGGGSELNRQPSTGGEALDSALDAEVVDPLPLDGSAAAAERTEMERLAAAQRAAGQAGEAAARWWIQLGTEAETAVTRQSLDELFRSALAAMADVLDAHAVAVLLANEAEDELIARAAFGLDEEIDTGLRIPSGEGVSGRVIASRQPLVIDDLTKTEVAPVALRGAELRSLAAVPMLAGDRLLGVLQAGSRLAERFSGTDVELLEMMAGRLAGAVDRVRSFESERAARKEAERNADRLDRLQKITSALLAASSEEDIASALTETVGGTPERRRLFWCGVWLRRADGLEPINIALPESLPESLRHVDFDSDHPLAAVARERTPVFVSDAATTLAHYPQVGAVPAAIESFAVFPIVLRGACLGAFVATYARRHRFEPVEREFLAAAVDQVALALESVRLHTQARQIADMSSFFADAAKILAEASDLADTLDRLASLAVGFLGDICLIDVVGEDGELTRMVARHRDPARQRLDRPVADRLRPRPGRKPPGRRGRRDRPHPLVPEDARRVPGGDHPRRGARGARTSARVPLLHLGAAERRRGDPRRGDPRVDHPLLRRRRRVVRRDAGQAGGRGDRQRPPLRQLGADIAHPPAEPAAPVPPGGAGPARATPVT